MRIEPSWVDAAGALYLAAVRASRKGKSLDVTTTAFLREHRALGDAGRAFVVDVAQGMMRSHRRLEAAARALGEQLGEPTRAALAALYLVGARGMDVRELPLDPRGGDALAAAWRTTDALSLDVRASLPAWLVEEVTRLRADSEALCLSFLEAPPLTLRANGLRTTAEEVRAALEDEGFSGHPGRLAPDAVVLDRRANVFRTGAFRDGLFEVQDEGSQLVSLVCQARAGMTVVDGCCGAGGKTLHLAALMEGKGTLYAFDVANHRLEALRERSRRAGAHNVRVHSLDDTRPRKRLADSADVVLVDAPCSGSGVLRRNPDTSWRLQSEDVDRMRAQQAEILDAYAPLVKPGGRLVYATCSILARENHDTVAAFLARSPAFRVVRVDEILRKQGVFVPGTGEFLELDPSQHGTDGFFACALERAP